jgi:thioredoxin 1
MSSVTVITDNEFPSEVLESTGTVLVYFWAPWCGPCRLMAPLVDGAAQDYNDRLKIFKMEVDPNPDAVAKCSVQGVPALVLFKDGQLMDYSEGAIGKQKLASLLDSHV